MGPLVRARINGEGTPEKVWGPYLDQLPTGTRAASLVPHYARVVVVSPHPDDETLGTGGLLAELVEQGRPFLLVAVTDGGASHPRSGFWTRASLERIRNAEQMTALRRLGVAQLELVRIALPDGAIAKHKVALTMSLLRHITGDDVVFAPFCDDGHPDHDAVGRAVKQVCALVHARLYQVPIWMWHWATPGDATVPWNRMLRVELGRAALARKRHAIESFKSQITADPSDGSPPILTVSTLERFQRPFETVFR